MPSMNPFAIHRMECLLVATRLATVEHRGIDRPGAQPRGIRRHDAARMTTLFVAVADKD
jgi:hypothetical protein